MSISVLSIAQAEGLQHPIRTRKLAESRGINHARFTLRELLTSQKQSTAAPMPGSWQNWIEDYDNGAQVVRPSNKEELMGAVLFAVKGGMKIRAVGSGHSHSKAAEPEDVFVDLSRLSGMLSHRDWLKQSPPGLTSNDQLVRIQAGTTLKRLNRNLLKSRDLALANMGSFDGQTIAGAISTATHGTGVALPTLADMVASMEMVTAIRSVSGKPIVQMLRIEPTDGITDRSKFEADQAVHDTVLLQDDDTFYSAVVSYGCMGIAYA